MKQICSTKWNEKESATKRKASALRLAKLILRAKGVLESHKKEFLSSTVWKVTEANGKYNTRFVSEGVCRSFKSKEHEHVIPREVLVCRMMQNPKKVKTILYGAIGCLVTKREHKKLKKGIGNGWGRYRSVKIRVYDRKKEQWMW